MGLHALDPPYKLSVCRTFAIAAMIHCFLAAGCRREPVTLTGADRGLAATTGVPERVLLRAKELGQNMRQLEGIDDDDKPFIAAGITVDVDFGDALSAVKELRQAAGEGFLAFVSERNFGIEGQPDHVSVLKCADPFAARASCRV